MPPWRTRLADSARKRSEKNLVRAAVTVTGGAGCTITRADGTYIDLCSNDYLALSRHPEVVEGAREAASRFGAGARGSRLITGNYALLDQLEEELAHFKGTGSALVFPSGYQANLGLAVTLLDTRDAVFVDRLAHACLVDGVRLSGAKLRVFPHNDLTRLEELLDAARDAPARWILVDAVYSMDGDIAPLPALLDLARRHDATIILDDAHGTGVLGARGRGTAEHFGINPRHVEDHLIIVATLSKAIGAQGGVVFGPPDLREALINTSRPFVYSTGIAPPCAGAALAAIRIIAREPDRVAALQSAGAEARRIIAQAGLNIMASETPIIPISLGDPSLALEASRQLREKGLLVLPIRPPTVPRGTSRLRLTVTANHGIKTIAECSITIAEVCRYLLSQPAASSMVPPGGD